MSNAVEALRAAAEICHPKPTRPLPAHFAAHGFVQDVRRLRGRLRHQTQEQYSCDGEVIRQPSRDTGFWVIRFVLPKDFPVSDNDKYTLEVFNADDFQAGTVLPSVAELRFFRSSGDEPAHPEVSSVVVDYSQNDVEVGSEFAAYGTAPASLNVTGAFSGCTGTITPGAPGPNWVLYCQDTGSPGSQCTLNVKQSGANPGQGTFEIAPA
jgi:hypothetical protein